MSWFVHLGVCVPQVEDHCCTGTRPLLVPPRPRLLLSQTFTCIDTLATSSQLFLFIRPIQMEQCVPKRRHLKFRRHRITQNKEHNRHPDAMHHLLCILYKDIAILIATSWKAIAARPDAKDSCLRYRPETHIPAKTT